MNETKWMGHAFGVLLALTGLSMSGAPSSAPSPAQLVNPVKETELTSVVLTAQAETRLGVVTVPVERKPIRRSRRLGGTVVLPMASTDPREPDAPIRPAPDPPASTTEVLKLAEVQAAADGELMKAQVEVEAARIALERATRLLQAETGSQRAVDESRALLRLAEATLTQAELRRSLLGAPVGDTAALDQVWIKVPVYVGDLRKLDREQEVEVGGLADRPGAPTLAGQWTAGPPSANSDAATVDWFYEVKNPGRALRLGQRVGVRIPLRGEAESLVVPWAAVLHDLHGGQWVYEATTAHTFVRRRVQVERVVGREAILGSGPNPGAQVVTDGAAELFGTEFGAGK